jgi:subtilisin inhibitor-like
MRPLALLFVVAVLAAGCGSESSEAGGPSTSLTITARWAPGAKPIVRTLRCDPVGGTLKNRGAACRRLAALAHPFAETPADTACTEIYGGPETATVTGTFEGAALSTTFARTDGCEIERWAMHRFLFPATFGGIGS